MEKREDDPLFFYCLENFLLVSRFFFHLQTKSAMIEDRKKYEGWLIFHQRLHKSFLTLRKIAYKVSDQCFNLREKEVE